MSIKHSEKIELGSSMPPFSLPASDGNNYAGDDFSNKDILVITFTCNHCPYAQHAKPKLEEVYKKYKDQSVQFIAINPNDEQAYPEDSFAKMKTAEHNYPFPYLRDESQQVAKEFGAACTPDIYVYDKNRKLAYHGQLDDERPGLGGVAMNVVFHKKIGRPHQHGKDLIEAIDALLKNQPPKEQQKSSMGCSIKWLN
ncbi:thioredoxin family protein [Patescibacteria group bacterium]